MKKSAFEIARSIDGGIFEAELVARSDDLNRPLTKEETIKELQYLLETAPYSPDEEEEINRTIRACKNAIRRIG